MSWTLNDVTRQEGKTVLVTGSNTGIGYATARQLAGHGATVILACRNPAKGDEALRRLKTEVPGADVELVQLDLANLASVRQCAAEIKARHTHIDALINNAGLMMPPLQRTADGFEMQFGTNVLGHFALTALLMPLLEHAPAARVVWLSSVAHWRGRIDFGNLNAEKGYSAWGAYAQSKLADLMLAYEMQRRLQRRDSPIISLGAHPGGTKSDLSRHNPMLMVINAVIGPFTQSAQEGAMPSLRAALDPAARGGEYYGPGGFATFTGPAAKQRSSQRSHDELIAARLWQKCEELTGERWLD